MLSIRGELKIQLINFFTLHLQEQLNKALFCR
jgi:hypothetical protein